MRLLRWAAVGLGLVLSLVGLWQIIPGATLPALVLMKISAITFGGGWAMIPLCQYEVVENYHWLTTKEFIDAIALGQITPGPIMINVTFLGYKLGGWLLGIGLTIAVFLPPFLIVIFLIPYFDYIKQNRLIQLFIRGILIGFVSLVALVLVDFGQVALAAPQAWLLAAAAYVALSYFKVDILYVVLVGAAMSPLLF